MFDKIKKYVIGFFVLCGGILFAFLSGKSAGRKQEKLGRLRNDIKKNKKSIKGKEKLQKNVKKSLESKKKALKEIKKSDYKKKNFNSKETAEFLKKYKKR
jgi:septal ring factor EnvC (AmiA/AmiB activator)